MRRTLAGALFGLAYLCAALAVSGWMLQRTAFSPDRTSASASTVLGDSAIKDEIVNLMADAIAQQLQILPATAKATILDTLGRKGGPELLAQIAHDAHARLIGERSQPVQITSQQLVQVWRNENVSEVPPITLPVPRVAVLDWMRLTLKWLVPICALAALLFAAIGFTAHPERSALLRSLGFGLLLLAALFAVLGYVVPRFVIPLLSKSPWAHIPIQLADDSVGLLIGVELVLVGAGLALIAGSGAMRRRSRWSAPISTYRYNEGRHWS